MALTVGDKDYVTEPSGDDEQGYTILYEAKNTLTARDNFGHTDRREPIECCIGGIWRGKGRRDIVSLDQLSSATTEAVRRHRAHLRILKDNRAIPRWVKGDEREFVLDYLPWIGQMATLDDEIESRTRGQQKRATRNSQLYYRTIELTEEERGSLSYNRLH
jgi:hypothetical protein